MKRALGVALLLTLATFDASATEWVFEGNDIFASQRLLSALQRYDVKTSEATTDATTADDAAFFLREFYFSQGFPDADVTCRFSPEKVVFSISEGSQLWIRSIRFEGGEEIATDRLRSLFTTAIRQATRAPFGRLRFVESALDDAAERLRTTFVNEGFLDAQVTCASTPSADFRTTDVTVLITPGIRHTVGAIRLSGPTFPAAEELLAELSEFSGRPFRPSDQALCRSRAVDFLRAHGYYFARASVSPSPGNRDGVLDFIVEAEPGRRMTIGKVTSEGTPRTTPQRLLARFGIRSGQPFNASALDAAERRLWFSGSFARVDAVTTPLSNNTVDLALRVEEGRSRSLATTVGYSEWYQAFATSTFTDRNFLGGLDRLRMTGFVSQKSYGGEVALSDPWILGTDLTGTAEAFALREKLPAFEATEYGARLGLSQTTSLRSATGWGLTYEWKSVANARVFSTEQTDDNYRLGRITFRQQLDRRNDPLVPISGYNLSYDAGIAAPPLLGDLSFFKASAQATWYVPLRKIESGRAFVPFLTLNHRAGLILPFGNTDSIPIPERLFLGGPDSVRSFQFDGMAPRDRQGVPVGGLAFLQANVELQWPVGRGFFLAAFTDFGNLAPRAQDMELADTRVAPGLGVRFYTPLGALRVDYAANLVRKEGDPIGAWQFGIGATF